MKDLAKTIGGILFWIFVVLVFFWTASLSLGELRIILPNDPIQPYIGLILTDVGALVWLLVFIGRAKGLVQRSIAILMLIVDLAGVILLAGGRLLTAGQTLTEIPEQLGSTLVWGLIGLTLLNLLAAYCFHLADPATAHEIEFGVLTDKLEKEALNQARRNLEGEAQRLGAVLAARATARLKYDMRLPMNDQESARMLEDSQMNQVPASKQVIDARATDQPARVPFWKRNRKQQPPAPVDMAGAATVATYPQDVDQVKPISDEYKKMYRPGTVFKDGTSLPIGWTCANCQTDNHVGAKQCARCGLTESEAESIGKQRNPQEDKPSAGPFQG